MNHLLRSLAPITDSAWDLLDEEARERLHGTLAARRLVDFAGPHGWEHSATNLGRVAAVKSIPAKGVTGSQRRVLPLVELRSDFSLAREELRDHDRGAVDIDLTELDDAAHRLAVAENVAVFHGWPSGRDLGDRRGRAGQADRAWKKRRGLPPIGRQRGRAAVAPWDRGAVRPRARSRRVHTGQRDRRARRLPAAQPPRQDPRGARSSGHLG